MAAKLSSCLRSLENLRTVHIGVKRRSAQHSRILSPYIVECTWKNLHTLHLSGQTLSQVDLVAFLARHASTLREFELGMAYPRNAQLSSPEYYGNEIIGTTGKDFFISLNRNLKLEKLRLRGMFHFKHAADFQAYGAPDPSGEEDWNFEESSDMRSSVDDYVVSGGDWPLQSD